MRSTRIRVVMVAVVSVLAAAAAATGFGLATQDRSGETVVAEFASAAPLVTGNQVKYHGVVVGEVLDLKTNGHHADVLMRLDPTALPLHRDAHATIRSISLLGERYVDLDRGSPQAPELPPGRPIPQSQTGSNVDLDQVLNVLDDPTSQALSFLVTTLGEGVKGNGANADSAIKALAPSLRDTRALTGVLNNQNQLLNHLVDQVEPVAGALATDDGKSMDRLVGSADKVLTATRNQQQALDTTLTELPSTLQAARTSLGNLAGTAQQTTPTLQAVRPTTDNLQAISGELTRFSDSLDPALATAQPVLQRADRLLDAAKPVAAHLRAAGPGLSSTAASARPITADLTANLDNVFHFIRYWALATNGHDGLSHYLRVNMIVNPAALTGQVPGAAPGAPSPAAPAPAPNLPGLTNVPGLLQPPPPGQTPPPGGGGVTGLNQHQETGMMGFLLGGGS